MRLYSQLVILAVLLVGACASLPKTSIEATVRDLRAACKLIGEPDLDACAARLADEAK